MLPVAQTRGIVRVMLCPKCGKESQNVRVCAHCQTPYPLDSVDARGGPRNTRGTASLHRADPRRLIANLSSAQRRGLLGLLAVLAGGYYFATRERAIPTGVAVANLIAAPMSAAEAASTLRTVNENAQVEVRNGELTVRISAATFPQQRAGLLALAQQYARADAIVEGRTRAIRFLDPDGNLFARADVEKGVMLTR